MDKNNKVIDIGDTQAKVIVTHARKSLLYFIRNFVDANLVSWQQENILRRIDKKRNKDDKA